MTGRLTRGIIRVQIPPHAGCNFATGAHPSFLDPRTMRLYCHALSLALLATVTATLGAQPSLRPAPSSRATTEVTLSYPRDQAPPGATPVSIRIDYGQPHLRGRPLHTDSLVPFDKPWRTGANAATTLTTGVDLVIGGKLVPKGTYVLSTLPRRAGWELVVQQSAAAGTMQPATQSDTAKDVARIALAQQAAAVPLESLTMWLIPSTAAGPARGELRIAWGAFVLSAPWEVR